MKIAAIKEQIAGESRTAITPDTARLYVKKGYEVWVESGIGNKANYSDQEYKDAGAKISSVLLEIISDADIILKVQPTPITEQKNEIALAKKEAIIIGLFLSDYNNNHQYINKSLLKKITTIAMELIPRITKTQDMDTLSSQSNLLGYRSIIEASYYFDRAFPMMITSAGKILAAKILVLGAGVAGLQAIATAKRLGGIVSAYDVRATTKEQIESLGAKFVYPDSNINDMEDSKGYAKKVDKEFDIKQKKFLSEIISDYDIIISTAQILAKKAPILITNDMILKMKAGSILVDLAINSGGNIEGSVANKVITKNNIKIIAWSNLLAKIAKDSSRLYAKNLYNFVSYAIQDGKFNFSDELVKSMLVGFNNQIVSKYFIE